MHPFTVITQQQREQAVALFEQGFGYTHVATRLGIRTTLTKNFHRRWILHGSVVLVKKSTKSKYSYEVKKEVVDRFLAGESKMGLAAEFQLSSPLLVTSWAKSWRAGGDDALKPKPKGRPPVKGVMQPVTEEEQLRKRVKYLEAENAYLKKITGLEEPATRLKVQVLVALKSSHDLEDLLQISMVARSTFYYHARKLDTPDKHAELKNVIRKLFEDSQRRYGHRRIWLKLRALGWQVTKKLVHKLMNQLGLRSKARVKRKYNSYRGTRSLIAPNVMARQFEAVGPNLKWVSDVTEFRVSDKKVYLSPVMDLFDHSIVGYKSGTSPNVELTSASLQDAFTIQKPGAGALVHTDQGVQ
mgnify:CR=1 FL=1